MPRAFNPAYNTCRRRPRGCCPSLPPCTHASTVHYYPPTALHSQLRRIWPCGMEPGWQPPTGLYVDLPRVTAARRTCWVHSLHAVVLPDERTWGRLRNVT